MLVGIFKYTPLIARKFLSKYKTFQSNLFNASPKCVNVHPRAHLSQKKDTGLWFVSYKNIHALSPCYKNKIIIITQARKATNIHLVHVLPA